MSRPTRTPGNARVLLRTATAALSTLTFLVCGTPTAHTACLAGGPRLTQAGGRPSRAPHQDLHQKGGTGQQPSYAMSSARTGPDRPSASG